MFTLDKLIFLCLVCFFCASCNKENQVNEFLNIGDDLELSLSQNVDANGPYYELQISTIDSISCTNSKIVSSSHFNQNKLIISLEGIVDNECDLGHAKPTTEEKLSELNLEMPFSISIKDVLKANGRVTKTDEQANLFLEDNNGIVLKNKVVLPISPNTFFGVVESDDNTDLFKFFLSLDGLKNNAFTYKQGNYGLFTASGSQISFPQHIKTKKNSFSFYFQYKDWNDLEIFVRQFLENNPQVKLTAKNCYNVDIVQ